MRPRNVLASVCIVLLLLLAPHALAGGNGRGRGGGSGQAATAESASASTAGDEGGNATLVVLVNATGADGTFAFESSGGDALPDRFSLTTREGSARLAFGGLRAGHAYALREVVPAGWNLTRAACTSGSPEAIVLPENGTVACTFENERLGTLLVRVNVTGAEGVFPVTVGGNGTAAGLPANFTLATLNGTAGRVFTVLPGHDVSLSLAAPAGWNLTRAACTAGTPANLTVGRNETVTCWFEAERLNALHVKVAARGGDLALPFHATGGGGLPPTFQVTTTGGAANVSFADLETDRTYALAPQAPAGWKVGGAHCDAGTPDAIMLAAGRSAACQFNLTRLAHLTVVVLARGGDALFGVTATGGSLPALFHVQTTNGTGSAGFALDPDATHALHVVVDGTTWRLASAACTTATPGNLTVAPGGSATCTFVVSRLGEIRGTLWHDRDRDGARDADEGTLAGWTLWLDADADGVQDAGERLATTGATGGYAFADLPAGHHQVRLALPALGWAPTTPHDGLLGVSLAEGALSLGHDFGVVQHGQAAPPAPRPDDGKEDGPRGQGWWRNAERNGKVPRADLDAWVRAVANASAWLMPAGYAEDAAGLRDLLEDATKRCNRTFGHHGCAQKKMEASLLVLRLNVQSGRLAPTANANIPPNGEAATYLGLPPGATVQQLLDAIDAKATTKPTRDQLQLMRATVQRAMTDHEG